jgi:hypothetical protein
LIFLSNLGPSNFCLTFDSDPRFNSVKRVEAKGAH